MIFITKLVEPKGIEPLSSQCECNILPLNDGPNARHYFLGERLTETGAPFGVPRAVKLFSIRILSKNCESENGNWGTKFVDFQSCCCFDCHPCDVIATSGIPYSILLLHKFHIVLFSDLHRANAVSICYYSFFVCWSNNQIEDILSIFVLYHLFVFLWQSAHHSNERCLIHIWTPDF